MSMESLNISSEQAFFEKYDWREVQELLSLTSCSWLLSGEEFLQPVDPPPGMVRQIQVFHPNAIILAPCDSGVSMDYKVVHQIIRELTVGIYCFNQVPSISLEPNPDQSSACHLTPAYCDTKVGQILINIDYTMKALWHGAYIPKEKRPSFLELWRSSRGDPSGVPQAEKDRLAEFLTEGPQCCLSICQPACLSVFLPICLFVYLPAGLSVSLPACLSVCMLVYLSVCLPVYLPACLTFYLSVGLSVTLSVCLSGSLSFYLSVYLPACLPVSLSVCLYPPSG